MTVYDRWLNPVPEWDHNIWEAGHFGSGREPSTPKYSSTVNARAHAGIDLAAPYGSAIVAPLAGTVTQAGYANSGAGYTIHIEHTLRDGTVVYSRHLHCLPDFPVIVGQTVGRGQLIAYIGMTGSTAGPHNHFEIILGQHGPVDMLTVNGLPDLDLLADPELLLFGDSPRYLTGGREWFQPPKEVLESTWLWALDQGLMLEEHSDPWDPVDKQEMAAFFNRYWERIDRQ